MQAKLSLFRRCSAFCLVVPVDVVAFAAAVVVDVALVVRFYVVCVVADIAILLLGVSGFLLEAADVLFDVVGVLVLWYLFFMFLELFWMLLVFLLLVVVLLLML